MIILIISVALTALISSCSIVMAMIWFIKNTTDDSTDRKLEKLDKIIELLKAKKDTQVLDVTKRR